MEILNLKLKIWLKKKFLCKHLNCVLIGNFIFINLKIFLKNWKFYLKIELFKTFGNGYFFVNIWLK